MPNLTYLHDELIQRESELQKILKLINKYELEEPEGKLRISMNSGSPQYYYIVDSKDTRGKYIPKKNQKLAVSLAKKDYYKRLKKEIVKELKALRYLIKTQENSSPESVYSNLNDCRKNLINI